MSTATTNPEEARELAQRLAADADQLNRAVEAILWEYDEDIPIHPGDFEVLRMAGFDAKGYEGKIELERERSRITAVKDHIFRAGTNGELTTAKDQVAATREAEKKRGGEIKQKLQELEQELGELTDARALAEAALNGFETARESLRKDQLLPQFIRDRLAHEKKLAGAGIKKPIAELDSKLSTIDAVLKLSPDSNDAMQHAEVVARQDPQWRHLIEQETSNNVLTKRLNKQAFEQYQTQLQLDRPRIEQELGELKAEYEQRLEEFDNLRDFYIDQIRE